MKLNSNDKLNGIQTKRIETHAHTSEGSPCGKQSAHDTIKLYAQAGFDVLILTNHYSDVVIPHMGNTATERTERYIETFNSAHEYGKTYGIDVWFGIEVTMAGTHDDFLIYGVTPEFVRKNPEMYNMSQKELFDACEQNDFLLYQAHPFRNLSTPRIPTLMHGAEIYNGRNPHEKNSLAYEWAKSNGLRVSSGSDFHDIGDVGRGGILVPEYINDTKALTDYMRNNAISLITE